MKYFTVTIVTVLVLSGGMAFAQTDPLLRIKPDAYGLGVNSDQYGRPHKYETQDRDTLPGIVNEKVERNAYGLGVHKDQFGKRVRDKSYEEDR